MLLQSTQTGFLVMEDDDVKGILVKDNIINGLSGEGKETKVKDVMITEFKHVEKDTPLRDIFQVMQQKKTEILPVYEKNKVAGIIDQENIQEFIMVQSALHGG